MVKIVNYKKIYSAANSTEAHLIQGLFEHESIQTRLSGEHLTIAAGGLPADVFQIDILVDEEMYAEALAIISNYEKMLRQPVQDGKSWECEECKKINPDTFEICWNCQVNRLTVA
tara:strand:- start:14 stop:358 length:345 start_codon:yes stop_codon:yes gene_type:complete